MQRVKATCRRPEVIVLSDGSCPDEENSQHARNNLGWTSAAAGPCSEITVKSLPGEPKMRTCAKVAPVFLRATRRSRNNRSSDTHLPEERTQGPAASPLSPLTVSTDRRAAVSPRRGQLSSAALHICLQEIQTSSPTFPVRDVFSSLQKKAGDRLQDGASLWLFREKRKRGGETSPRGTKRLRSHLAADGAVGTGHCQLSAQDVQSCPVPLVVKQPRSGRLSRSHRLRKQSGAPAGLVNDCQMKAGRANRTDAVNQTPKGPEALERVCCVQDTLWTDKYSPQHSREIIGNSASVTKLQSWLKKWKLRADCEERRRRMEERKREENSNDSWDCGDFQGEAGEDDDGEETLCNTVLITGPPGVGKTASVYACAQELGFKVFEVNCSSQRSGRHVLSQLKEATQSHLVETSGKDPLKPAYMNNYNTSSCSSKSKSLHMKDGKSVFHKNVNSVSRKRAACNLSCSVRKVKTKPPTATLAHYFKMKARADRLHLGGPSPSEQPADRKVDHSSPGSDQTMPQSKKSATSLILFEEVDVIFDDDVGFLAAIKAFMATTKRPVVLTTNDPTFRKRFDGSLEEVVFKPPSAASVCSYLQLVCLAEEVRVDLEDVRCLLRLTCGDVRRCLLQLQLWVQSGGDHSGSSTKEKIVVPRGFCTDSQLRPSCSADMLGLRPVTLNFLLNHLKCQSWSEMDMNELLKLLAESWRKRFPLLYTNLDLLLDEATFCELQMESSPSKSNVYVKYKNPNTSPNVSVQSVRNISKLRRKKKIVTTSDGLFSNSTHKPQRPLSLINGTSSTVKAEQKAAKVVRNCLDALSDFFDLMSCLDSSLPAGEPLVPGSCTPEAFVWTGAEVNDSLLDEMSEEDRRNWIQERLQLDIQAAVEGFGCRRYWWRVWETWAEAQSFREQLEDKRWRQLMDRLTLDNSSKRRSLSFSFQPLCAPSVTQRRYKLSRTVLSSKYFSMLGNREAVCADYMPILRFICRSHNEEAERCSNYLSREHLGISKVTMQLMAEDFPGKKTGKTPDADIFTPFSIY